MNTGPDHDCDMLYRIRSWRSSTESTENIKLGIQTLSIYKKKTANKKMWLTKALSIIEGKVMHNSGTEERPL